MGNSTLARRDYTVKSRLTVLDPTTHDSLHVDLDVGIIKRRTIARGRAIREIERLTRQYRHPSGRKTKPSDWTKEAGITVVTHGESKYVAEIHWYQGKGIGKVEFKIKRYIDELLR